MLVHLRPLLRNGNAISSSIDATLPYLLFEDGVFHIPTQTFTPGFDKTKVFTSRINRKFPAVRDATLELLVNTKLFVLPLQNEGVGKYLKMRLARSLAGCYRDKKFVCVLGEADCSKGTLTLAMRKAFGDFVVEYNANHLKYNARSGADEAKKLSWLIPIQHARLAISNEVRMDKIPIDGNLLKSLSSGGDEIGARLNFKDEYTFVPKTSFFFMGNDMPEITPKDSGIETRVRVVRFNKRFVTHPVGANELPADETIKDKLETDEWKNAIFWLIMDAYRYETAEPGEVCEETKEWIPSGSGEFREALEERFVINVGDTSEDNWTSSKDIIGYVKERGMNMSDTKIGRELGKLGLVKDAKKMDGKKVNVWKGLR
jgi:phage/plasmid-associated DNA primase